MKPNQFLIPFILLLITACAPAGRSDRTTRTPPPSRSTADTPSGQIGHGTEASLTNVAVQSMLEYMITFEMDQYDRRQLNHAFERGMSGQLSAWMNPDTGNQFLVTPKPGYSNHATKQTCREAEIVAVIDGRQEKLTTTACRTLEQSWQLQN